MPALNFKGGFAHWVEKGQKCQSIRPIRKRPIQEHDRLFLYTGMRTRKCRKLGEATVIRVRPITIEEGAVIHLEGFPCTPLNVEGFVFDDGFASISEFTEFFRKQYGLPFRGVLIQWDLDDRGQEP